MRESPSWLRQYDVGVVRTELREQPVLKTTSRGVLT
jgi:hypothetical protein